ncbi:WXG100 family type VII secretion target (plasmid) [Streptomyces sp. AHU1]|uniref:WXG100 family type VII secretion target n=1 Tax=Streptomyces sp. AHU1 TaxID=3377215 RepID=UPI00387793D7
MPDNLTDGSIYVDYNHVDNAAEDMVMQTKAIANTISHLEMELNALVKSWYGEDASAYHDRQRAWDQAVRNMETMLNSHANLLNEISGSYKFSENGLADMWSQIKIGS